jgi:hypothetical protein
LKFFITFFIVAGFLLPNLSYADISNDGEAASDRLPWSKGGIVFSYFITSLNTDLRFGAGLGIDIDAEETLGMDDTSNVYRLNGYWRFSDNLKHRFELNWFSLHREGSRTIGKDIIIEKPGEGEIEIPLGTSVESYLNIDLYQGVYSYSIFLDDRLDLAFRAGLYVAPIETELKAEGIVETETKEKFIAPLPTFGLRADIAITPKWFVRTGGEVFYLKYNEFVGYIFSSKAVLEYMPWKHFGIGAGFDILRLFIESDGREYAGVDLKGTVEFEYIGMSIYGKIVF